MALSVLEIGFIVMSIVSGLGIIFLYLVKNQRIKSVLIYFLGIWGIGLAYVNVTRWASNYSGQRLIALTFGFLAVAGIFIKMIKPEKTKLAQLFVTAATLFSVMHILLF